MCVVLFCQPIRFPKSCKPHHNVKAVVFDVLAPGYVIANVAASKGGSITGRSDVFGYNEGVLLTVESFLGYIIGHAFLLVMQRKVAASPFAQKSGKADASGPVVLMLLFCSESLVVVYSAKDYGFCTWKYVRAYEELFRITDFMCIFANINKLRTSSSIPRTINDSSRSHSRRCSQLAHAGHSRLCRRVAPESAHSSCAATTEVGSQGWVRR